MRNSQNGGVIAEFPNSTCVEGSGGDQGIDCFVPCKIDKNKIHVFQHKFFTDTLGTSGKKQINESLEQVLKLRGDDIYRSSLLIAKDLTPGEINWFNEIQSNYPSITFDIWGYSKLRFLLRKHYRIYYEYFPLPIHIKDGISKHLDDLKNNIVKPLIEFIKNSAIADILSMMNHQLCIDLTTNHYPELSSKLQQVIDISNNIESRSVVLQENIMKLLVEYLADNKIKYRDGDDYGTYLMTDSIPIRQLLERLWLLVETDSYTDNNFWVDKGYPDMIRIGFSNLGQGIMYQCLPDENPEEIVRKLQVICNNIIYGWSIT